MKKTNISTLDHQNPLFGMLRKGDAFKHGRLDDILWSYAMHHTDDQALGILEVLIQYTTNFVARLAHSHDPAVEWHRNRLLELEARLVVVVKDQERIAAHCVAHGLV